MSGRRRWGGNGQIVQEQRPARPLLPSRSAQSRPHVPFSAKPSSLRARLVGTSGSLCDPPRPLAPQPHPSQAQGSHRDAAGAWLERHFSLEGVGPLPDLPGKPGGTAHPVPEMWLLRERGMWPLELPLVPRRLGPGWRLLRTATENPATPPHPWSHPVPAGAAFVTRGGDVAWSASWLMSWASASASGQKKNLRTQEANEIFGQENDL